MATPVSTRINLKTIVVQPTDTDAESSKKTYKVTPVQVKAENLEGFGDRMLQIFKLPKVVSHILLIIIPKASNL
jgi:hypothetical protein